jgi:O-antigen/teichoic acid export membrane protein
LTNEDRSTIFWTGAAVGLVCTLAGVALAAPLAAFYGEPAVSGMFAALSLSFFVGSLGTTQAALLARELDFRALELRQMIATIVGASLGIFLAVDGYGAWAIVWQQVAVVAASTILLWIFSPWRPSFVFTPSTLRNIGSFTGNVFGQNLVYYAGRSVDRILIGRVLGAPALGVYSLAYNIMLTPFNQIAGPLQQVFFPALSQLRDDRAKVGVIWIRATRIVGAIAIPSLAGLCVVAPDFVDAVLGPRWDSATPVLRILVWVGLIQALQTLNGDVLLALGEGRTLFRFTVVWFVASMLALVVGLHWGLLGVATAYAVSSVLVEPLNARLTAGALHMSVWPFFLAFRGIAEASVLMCAAVVGIRLLLVHQGLPAGARLVICILVGIAIFVPVCSWRDRDLTRELRSLVASRRGAAAVER